jgi:medium-chain acyl-[acyl-carrier-protein] hydrolase
MTNPLVDTWIKRPRPSPAARLRLFCLPYAGGAASVFHAWPQGLPPQVEVCAVQLPGREGRLREMPFVRVGPLVRALADVVPAAAGGRPFALFGHSNGAMLAFELARELARRGGEVPVHLFVSARLAPPCPPRAAPIHRLPEAEFVEAIRRLEGTPAEVLQNPELMQMAMPALRADFAVHETYAYEPGPPLECPVSAFGGLQDAEVPRADLAQWGHETSGAFKVRMLPGGHFFLATHRALLLQALSLDLAPALRARPVAARA